MLGFNLLEVPRWSEPRFFYARDGEPSGYRII